MIILVQKSVIQWRERCPHLLIFQLVISYVSPLATPRDLVPKRHSFQPGSLEISSMPSNRHIIPSRVCLPLTPFTAPLSFFRENTHKTFPFVPFRVSNFPQRTLFSLSLSITGAISLFPLLSLRMLSHRPNSFCSTNNACPRDSSNVFFFFLDRHSMSKQIVPETRKKDFID